MDPPRSVVEDFTLGKAAEHHGTVSRLIQPANIPKEIITLQNGSVFNQLIRIHLHRLRQIQQFHRSLRCQRGFIQVIFLQAIYHVRCGG